MPNSSKESRYRDTFQARFQELQARGFEDAFDIADFEARIAEWPEAWGDDLRIEIYGDFEPPEKDLTFPELRITIHREKVEKTIISGARCVLRATVGIDGKTHEALIDASDRINTLMGIFTYLNLGNPGCSWYCRMFRGSITGGTGVFQEEEMQVAIRHFQALSDRIRPHVRSALYWIREPQALLMESHRSDLLRVYSGYWNAFECLVEAAYQAGKKPSPSEKRALLRKFIEEHGPLDNAASIDRCFREIIDPGLKGRASQALRAFFPEKKDAEYYMEECFTRPDKEERLYDIRNAINHGTIVIDDPLELQQMERRLFRLKMIVLRMLGAIFRVNAIADHEANRYPIPNRRYRPKRYRK